MPHNRHGDIGLTDHRYLPFLVFAALGTAFFLYPGLLCGTSGPVPNAGLFVKLQTVGLPVCPIAGLDFFLIPCPLRAPYDLTVIPNSFCFYAEITEYPLKAGC